MPMAMAGFITAPKEVAPPMCVPAMSKPGSLPKNIVLEPTYAEARMKQLMAGSSEKRSFWSVLVMKKKTYMNVQRSS